jgi:ketosteroid isomerase-like protein
MSQTNVDLAKRMTVAFNSTFTQGTDDLYELVDPDVDWEPITARLDGTTYRGHDGVRQWVEDMKADWDEFETHVEEVRDLGDDRVLSLGRWQARGRASGVALDFQKAAWLLTFRGERVVSMKTFTDRNDAYQAAGISADESF